MTPEAPARTAPQSSPTTTLVRKPYPNYKVIVLDDNFNTFQHVTNCLLRYIPGMTPSLAHSLTVQVDSEGSAVVWVGPQEQAELYHMQLDQEGLTMAPLEAA